MSGIRCRITGVMLVVALALPLASLAAEEEVVFSVEQLDQMLAPIALHPDALLSQMLMASTYPGDVAEAGKWSAAHPDSEGDAAVEEVESEAWDPSVKSLVAFPQVLAMMGEKPDWVKELGDAFLAEPDQVMDRIQYLRQKSKEAGYLESNEWQKVTVEDTPPLADAPATSEPEQTTVVVEQPAQTIIIQQTNPQVIYVPAYDPMLVYGAWWWPRYRPWFWRPMYWGFGGAVWRGVGFGVGIGISNALWGGFRWGHGGVNINVNRYNNINVNNRIKTGDRSREWKHNPDRRGDAGYRDKKSRERFDGQRDKANRERADRGGDRKGDRAGDRKGDRAGDRQGDRAGRESYRGRDAQRDAAQRTLSDRGVDPAKGRDALRNDPKTRERAQAAARDIDRKGSSSGRDRSGARKSSGTADRSRDRAAAQKRERSQVRSTSSKKGRDSALSGVNRSSGNRKSASRGQSSRSSSHRAVNRGGGRASGGRGGGGGRRR